MQESFSHHPDFGVLASQLKTRAMNAGHSPEFMPNGQGMSMTCTDCGSQTHIQKYNDDNWHAVSSPSHRLHFNDCGQPSGGGTLTERLSRARG